METPLVERRPPPREGPAERSSTGAPRRMSRGATSCCRSRSPGLSEAAGLGMAVERLARKAVLGEAPEDLFFTLEDFDRVVNFSACTIGRCTDERVGTSSAQSDRHRLHSGAARRSPNPPPRSARARDLPSARSIENATLAISQAPLRREAPRSHAGRLIDPTWDFATRRSLRYAHHRAGSRERAP